MQIPFWLTGVGLGVAIAAPVGPIGILCIHRTLNHGIYAGFFSGLGAATADAVYGSIAGFGLVSVSWALLKAELVIRILGGLFLIFLGLKTWKRSQIIHTPNDTANRLSQDFFTTFMLTLTNPATILSFLALFSGFGIVDEHSSYSRAFALMIGIFMGSLLWWIFLVFVIKLLKSRLNPKVVNRLNQGSALAIIGFGLVAIGLSVVT